MMDFATLQTVPMELADLDEVMQIENAVFTHPWSKTNFLDSLRNSDNAWVVRAADGELLGYFVQMAVVDESHLLTVAVKASVQKQGLGNFILGLMLQQAKLMLMNSVLLEVRESNLPALKLYQQFGFEQIGRRKNYYQAGHQQREDALVLRYLLN
jgi:ribosomal-protein-alanine N-acetyltransferase